MTLMHDYYRNQLTVQGKRIYDGILQNISALASVGHVKLYGFYTDSVFTDARNAYRALRLDRPEYFFLGHTMSVSYNLLGLLTIRHNLKFSSNHVVRINKLLRQTVNELVSGTDGMSTVDKEKTIYQRIGKLFVYKESANAHDLSGLLVYKDGVCESLAAMLVVSLREVGIPAIVVQGYGRHESHRWSKVWIDGEEFYSDVTWDMSKCKNGGQLRYFNLTSKQMSKDHQMLDIFTNTPLAM